MAIKRKQELVFDEAKQDLIAKLEATLNNVLLNRAKKNLPIVYRNKYCIKKNQFIHEYPDGRKLLIQQNQKNSEEIVLRNF